MPLLGREEKNYSTTKYIFPLNVQHYIHRLAKSHPYVTVYPAKDQTSNISFT